MLNPRVCLGFIGGLFSSSSRSSSSTTTDARQTQINENQQATAAEGAIAIGAGGTGAFSSETNLQLIDESRVIGAGAVTDSNIDNRVFAADNSDNRVFAADNSDRSFRFDDNSDNSIRVDSRNLSDNRVDARDFSDNSVRVSDDSDNRNFARTVGSGILLERDSALDQSQNFALDARDFSDQSIRVDSRDLSDRSVRVDDNSVDNSRLAGSGAIISDGPVNITTSDPDTVLNALQFALLGMEATTANARTSQDAANHLTRVTNEQMAAVVREKTSDAPSTVIRDAQKNNLALVGILATGLLLWNWK